MKITKITYDLRNTRKAVPEEDMVIAAPKVLNAVDKPGYTDLLFDNDGVDPQSPHEVIRATAIDPILLEALCIDFFLLNTQKINGVKNEKTLLVSADFFIYAHEHTLEDGSIGSLVYFNEGEPSRDVLYEIYEVTETLQDLMDQGYDCNIGNLSVKSKLFIIPAGTTGTWTLPKVGNWDDRGDWVSPSFIRSDTNLEFLQPYGFDSFLTPTQLEVYLSGTTPWDIYVIV